MSEPGDSWEAIRLMQAVSWGQYDADASVPRLQEAAEVLAAELSLLCARLGREGRVEDVRLLHGAIDFIALAADSLDPSGRSEFRATIARRRAGKPMKRLTRARRRAQAGQLVVALVAQGMKQEAALAEAGEQFGLSRSELMLILRRRPERAGAANAVKKRPA